MLACESSTHSWRAVHEKTRAFNRSGGGGPRYDLRNYWRGKAYLAAGDAPEPIVRAKALEAVLARVPLHVYEGEMVAGSKAGFLCVNLPVGISAEDYTHAVDADRARGRRDFWAGNDHTLADYPALLSKGIGGLIEDARRSQQMPGRDAKQQNFLQAVILSLEAFSEFARRYAATCRDVGRTDVAQTLEAIASDAPTTFRDALQLVWLTETVFVAEQRYANALGRLDQYLLPFYETDLHAGRITEDAALDLLCHLWAKIEELGEVTNICIGGLTPDGKDATNALSYLCLKATAMLQTPHSNLSARFHDGSPEAFHRACFDCIRTGVGFPAIFNDHVLIPGLEEIGIPAEVARDYCMVGCIETMLPGRQAAWSDSRFNPPVCLLRAMKQMQGETGRSYERLLELFTQDVATSLQAHVQMVNAHAAKYPADRFPDPFLSALTQDCIGRARDVNDGGARFERFHGVCAMGLATIADSLAAVCKLVFEEKRLDYDQLIAALDADFQGHETTRALLTHGAPKYGNDQKEVDDIAAWFVDFIARECLKHQIVGGGRFVAAMAANTANIPAGKEVGATPDGRRAFTPLSDAASPYFGRDRNGPTAFLQSVSQPDYHLVLTGSVINMKFEPAFFADEQGAARFGALTRFFVAHRIPELQFNFTGNRILEDARKNPADYANLVVRVSGFSEYFTRLPPEVQDDIIRRRAHGA